MTLTQSLPARTARARSLYLSQLIDILRCARVEGGHSEYGSLRRLSEEAAQMACRLAFDARILWNAAQEQMYAADKDNLPLREHVRVVLGGALALAKDTLKEVEAVGGTSNDLQQEADRLRQELLATELTWDTRAGLKLDPKKLEQAQADTARGDLIDLEEWLRELQGSAG